MSENKNDPVNHPNHYQSESGLEVIDAIRAFTEDCQGIEGYYTGNAIKYICRWKKKNGLEDLKKARVYLNWLIEHEEKKNDIAEKNHPNRCGTFSWKDILQPAPAPYSNSMNKSLTEIENEKENKEDEK